MKKLFCFMIIAAIILSFASCASETPDECELSSGHYYMVKEFPEGLTPYLYLNFEDNSFRVAMGDAFSHAVEGQFTIEENTLTATASDDTFVFTVKDSNTLILRESTGYYNFFTENTEFVCDQK